MMAGHLELVTPSIDLEPGAGAEVVVRVHNDGEGVEAFQLTVSGEASSWARVEPAVLAVPAGETNEARIVFSAPPAGLSGAGSFGYRVRLSWASSPQGVTSDGVIEMGGDAQIDASLRPGTRGLRTSTAYVDLRNGGSAPARVTIAGDGDDLDVTPEPESLVVDGLTTESVRLRLRPRRVPLLRSRSLAYRVIVDPLHADPLTLASQVQVRPLVTTVVPVLVAVLLVSGVAVGATLGGGSEFVVSGDTTTAPANSTTARPTTTAPRTTTTTTTGPAAVDDTVPPVPPDQRRIAFQSARDGNFEIYTVAGDGGGAVNVTNHPSHDAEPAWSPDGHRIAFDSDRDEGPGLFEIYVMNADGTGIVRVTNSPGPDGYPSWSPDGTHIVFVTFRDGNSEIYSMPVDGSAEARRLTRHPGDDVRPAWSPDGETIVFASNRTGDYEIWAMRASDGGALTRLTDAPGRDMNPSWSPDGSRIAYDSSREGDREIYVMDANGSAPVRVTESPGDDVWPVWAADGGAIAFVSVRDEDEEIYVVAVDGTGAPEGPPRRLTTSSGTDSEPAW